MPLRRLRETTITGFVPVRMLEGKKQLPFPQPEKMDEAREARIRNFMRLHAAYAESGPSFDPDGKYLCGTCNQRIQKKGDKGTCTTVTGTISMSTGSCRLYERGFTDRSTNLPEKYSQKEAMYGERPQALGFGCFPRCGYGERAKEADKDGRDVWCGYWGVRVRARACCDRENGKDFVAAPGERK